MPDRPGTPAPPPATHSAPRAVSRKVAPAASKLPEATPPEQHRQRYRLSVPAPATTLLLGQREAGEPAKNVPPFGYSGANLSTSEDLFVNVGQRALFQGHSVVTFQAASRLDLTSRGPVILSSLSWGSSPIGEATESTDGSEQGLTDTHMVARRSKFIGEQALSMAITKTLFDGLDLARDILGLERGTAGALALVKSLAKDGVVKGLGIVGKLVGLAGEGYAMGKDGKAGLNEPPADGVTVASNGSIAMLTAGSAVHFAAGGFTFVGSTELPGMIADLAAGAGKSAPNINPTPASFSVDVPFSVSLQAGAMASMFGGATVALSTLGFASVSSGLSATFASKMSNATVIGKNVVLGQLAPAVGLIPNAVNPLGQRPTEKVTIEALKTISLESPLDVKVKALTHSVEAGTSAVKALVKAETTVGPFTLSITPAGATIGCGEVAQVKVSPDSVTISAGFSKVVVSAFGSITVDNGSGSSVKMVGPAMKISGAVVNIG